MLLLLEAPTSSYASVRIFQAEHEHCLSSLYWPGHMYPHPHFSYLNLPQTPDIGLMYRTGGVYHLVIAIPWDFSVWGKGGEPSMSLICEALLLLSCGWTRKHINFCNALLRYI